MENSAGKVMLDVDAIVSARIHPAIGIARIGNSEAPDGFFDGPELPYPVKRTYSIRDGCGKLKRQAARFRVYGYDAKGRVVGEITADDARIDWTVHVANKKAAWYDFIVALDLKEAAGIQAPRRNAQVQGDDRKKLVIDAGSESIEGRDAGPVRLEGTFFGYPVCLGHLRTDRCGRLRFLGGLGRSGTPFPHFFPPTTFADNPGWHDDISDGPVSATVTFKKRDEAGDPIKPIVADSAWVVTTPPNYAPDLIASQTLYDVIRDATQGFQPAPIGGQAQLPSFTNDILPLFRHFQDAQWLNFGYFAKFGWQGLIDFSRPDFIASLADTSDQLKELRQLILTHFRDPNASDFQPLKWPPIFGDAFGNFESPPVPSVGLAIPRISFQALQQWAAGNFINDYNPNCTPPQCIEHYRPEDQPALLDRAALTFCMGGPFHPGIELTWPMRRLTMYRSPFRLRRRPAGADREDYGDFMTQVIALSKDGPLCASGPGDLTKWLAVPWQTDAASCNGGFSGQEFPQDKFLPAFWLSRVPNQVLTQDSFDKIVDPESTPEERIQAFRDRKDWLRDLSPNGAPLDLRTNMISQFGSLGVIERFELKPPIPGLPDAMYVETLPPVGTGAATEDAPGKGD